MPHQIVAYNRVIALIHKQEQFISSTWTCAQLLKFLCMISLSLNWRGRDVTRGIPQGSVLGLQLFNIFASSLDNGIECTISKFADNTKLWGQLDTLEGRDVMQRHLDRLDKWACVNLINFNTAKCKDVCLGQGNTKHKYRLDGEWIESCPLEKDVEVLDKNLEPPYLELHQKKHGQQVGRGASLPPLHSPKS
ncbi:hypothetical protein TURU_140684 [Turdus rufiventris]|nr:hypothetical protein TURU_140684 [Turdus rufiventris]